MTPKKKIIWMIQANQSTAIILDYLITLKTRVERQIDLEFWVPESSSSEIDHLKVLNPVVFKTTTRTAVSSTHTFKAKKEALGNDSFSQGLLFSEALLIDDFGGGNTQMTQLDTVPPEQTCGLILQIPSPMGSSEIEERNFHAAILWARHHRIRSLGYEILPLDTRWTLAPSLPDGVATRYPESYTHLKDQLPHNNIWQLVHYEAAIFSPIATSFHLNGVKASYHYRNTYKINANKTVLFLPHNVAMIYDYKKLLQILRPYGKQIHLMFSVGKDQVRGGYTHEQMIQIIYDEELKSFASYSFHDMNSSWEIMAADAIVACAPGLHTLVGERELPCIIYDPDLPEFSRGNKIRVNTQKNLCTLMEEIFKYRSYKFELADIMMILART